jgi:small ligand-binding sensory domain FIST
VATLTRVGAGISTSGRGDVAAREAARAAAVELGDRPVDLACLFLSPPHADAVADGAAAVREELGAARLLGCVAEGVVGREHELEDGPAAAVWAASLPGAEIECFHADTLTLEDEVAVTGIPELGDAALLTLLVDPFTFPTASVLGALNGEYPGLPVVGGVAVAGGEPGTAALIVDDEVHAEGAVGAALRNVEVRAVVSQGCAPIGRDSVITSAEGNVVYELAGQPALERLRNEVAGLAAEEQVLAARGLLAGLVIDENRPEYGRGDYLMRGLIGVDEETGALAVGEEVRVGQTLRFHVRDARSADDDLRSALRPLADEPTAGALLFTCNGRGTSMFPEPHHDARLVAQSLGRPALAGFFCGGEIGPVGGQTFLHGFTATMAVFLDR